jgi:hypothetical protein
MEEVISDVSICNSALIKLGQDLIDSLSDDIKTARYCNARFPHIRNLVLEAHPWACATKTAELAPVSSPVTEQEDWDYAFEKPEAFLKMVRGEDWDVEFDTFDTYLMSNENPFVIKYIWKNTNAGTYSYHLAECIAWRLAADLAYALTQSREVSDQMMKGYEMDLKNARFHDAQKKTPEILQANTWVDARA